jgi:hypothetical protein
MVASRMPTNAVDTLRDSDHDMAYRSPVGKPPSARSSHAKNALRFTMNPTLFKDRPAERGCLSPSKFIGHLGAGAKAVMINSGQ